MLQLWRQERRGRRGGRGQRPVRPDQPVKKLPREVEAKLLVRNLAVLSRLARLRFLGPFLRISSDPERQENRYLDTKDLRLRKARAVLKIRRVGGKTEITFKRELSHCGGVSERIEVTGPEAVLRARKIVGSRSLQEILNLCTFRRRLLFACGKDKIELDLDQVDVFQGGRKIARHWEAELENRSAGEERFREALAELKRSFRGELRSSRVPKVEIGLRLLRKEMNR